MDNGSGNVARNNLWYDSVRTAHLGFDISHSWYYNTQQDGDTNQAQIGTGDPFVNLSGEDFRLRGPTNSGQFLSAPFDRDMDGRVRGADGNWDRGAFEFTSGLLPSPTQIPTPVFIQGDLDRDGDVDIFDYNILIENFGSTNCGNIADIEPSGGGDCDVDIFDYSIMIENFGKTS